MTREEAIKELEILKEDYWDDDGYGHETKQYDDTILALDMAIKALEQEPTNNYLADGCIDKWVLDGKKAEAWIIKGKLQIRNRGTIHNIDLPSEPILNKIRAEIEDMDAPNYDFEGFYKCQSEVLQIIDKYKAESEE